MQKIIKFIRSNLAFVLLLLFLIPSFIFLIRPGFFPMQDDLQAFRIYEMDKCFAEGQFPCRFVPDAGFQYSYPQFNYYPPSVYYFGEILHLIGFQFIDCVKILFALGFLLAGIFMFVFLRSIFGEYPALLGAILYTYTPYKAVDVYVRGALSEFWAFVFFPVIFWSIYQLIKSGKTKYLLWLALSTGLLLLTHNLMALIFAPLAGIWAVFWLWQEKRWKNILKIIGGVLLGLGLAAFFTLPVIFEKEFVHVDSMLGGYFDYRQHFVDINQLFISNHFGYGSSYLGPNDDLSLSTGIVQWILAVLAIILSIVMYKKNKKIALMIWVLTALDLLVLFMTHQKSSFVWEKLPILWWLQFPWRFLSDSIFILAILSASSVYLIQNIKVKYLVMIVSLLAVFILNISNFQPQKWLDIQDKDKFSGVSWEKQLTISIFDYLPIYATLPPWQKALDKPEVLEGKAEISNYQRGGDFQKAKINVSENALVRLQFFDFPGMEVKANGKAINHFHNDCRDQKYCLGLVTFNLEKGDYLVEAKINNTLIRSTGNIISLVSWLLLLILSFKVIQHERKDN